jgi:serine/threonine protein kinase
MMVCPNCQDQNPDSARFCLHCGQLLSQPHIAQDDAPRRPAGSLLGRVIDGKYRIEAVLAEGGIGSVYRARRLQIGDEVAVKTLQPNWANDAEMLERFRREAQTAARLKHPNVVTIHDFGRTADGQLYLVMELVEGRNLREWMRGHKPLDEEFIAEILEQISSALDEAHRHGIVHRDLKPENIVLSEAGDGWRVKVLDFGIAHWRDLAAGAETLTQSGAVLGTPRYMSPEQCLGQRIDGRSDVYTLGVMLFEMLTGTPPFNSPTPAAVIAQHLHHDPPPLRSLNSDISPAVEQLVLQALSKRREARQPTAGALARQFAAALEPAPVAPATTSTTHEFDTSPQPRIARPRVASPIYENTGEMTVPRLRPTIDAGETRRAARDRAEGVHKGCARDLFILVMLALVIGGGFTWWKLNTGRHSSNDIADSPPAEKASEEALRLARKLSPNDALARAEAAFKAGLYDEAITFSSAVLAKSPDQPRAEALLGQSYFNLGRSEDAVHLRRALALGAMVTLPIKHHHAEGLLKLKDSFCSGLLLLQKGTIEFRSDQDSTHNFRVTPQALIELREDAFRPGRIHTQIAVRGNGRVNTGRQQNYNFYPARTGVQGSRLHSSVACSSPICKHQADTIFQLLEQLK